MVKANIVGKVFDVIRNMYKDIKSSVRMNQKRSDSFVCHKGVRQGENLSPLLFVVYVNGIEESLIQHNCNYLLFEQEFLDLHLNLLVLMYADDSHSSNQ